jgi:CheY-like chemotaxis protein
MRILLVEDDDLRRATSRRQLEAQGCAVLEATTGEQTLELLRGTRRPLVVMLDYLLPEMCGYRLLEQIAAEPELAARHTFLVMTAHPALVESPLPQLGGRWLRLVPKPIEIARVRAVVTLAGGPAVERRAHRSGDAEPLLARTAHR